MSVTYGTWQHWFVWYPVCTVADFDRIAAETAQEILE